MTDLPSSGVARREDPLAIAWQTWHQATNQRNSRLNRIESYRNCVLSTGQVVKYDPSNGVLSLLEEIWAQILKFQQHRVLLLYIRPLHNRPSEDNASFEYISLKGEYQNVLLNSRIPDSTALKQVLLECRMPLSKSRCDGPLLRPFK
jgi:hypothetical protein